ncbi:MAG: ATP-binding protein, partial [SAR324 cluster bacterium]|nr:ATP-binding protein [SAR324 cluster bacterium]
EFFEYYNNMTIEEFEKADEDEVLQFYNHDKDLIAQSHNSVNFDLELNPELFKLAQSGEDSFEIVPYEGTRHLIYYFKLSERHVGRIAEPTLRLIEYEHNFIKLILISLPGVIFISLILSYWLVNLAMKPITLAFRYQETFSSNVTHELHTPLTSLKGNLEVGRRKTRTLEEYQEILDISLQETNKIIGLLNDLYLLAGSNFSPLDLDKKHINLKILVEEIFVDNQEIIAEKKIQLNVANLHDLFGVYDDTLISRAMINLIGNAIKYCLIGGEITVYSNSNKLENILTIENSSEPLSKEELKHIYDPFFRAKNGKNSNIMGKGLGLNICNYIVHSHEGKLKATSKKNGLFTIELTLPRN